MNEQKVALYRKYRPENFDQVAGQDHITKILSSAVKEDMVSHAYLFSGPRGTGKTSVARILAKSLSCENRKGYNPCGKCLSCKSIKEGHSMNLIEIDAASNRGIDEIRDLREKIRFAPAKGTYKTFIIDEVHMLTKEAFNALLKTLEEPPTHAFFILATTEINKVPSTIISRCQRHDFKRIKLGDISGRLAETAKSEKIKITDDAIDMIAETSDGGLRDALSILDQLGGVGLDRIKTRDVVSLVGLAPQKSVDDFVKSLVKKDSKNCLSIIDSLEKGGTDLVVFARAIQDSFSKVLIAKMGGVDQIEGSKEQLEKIQKISTSCDIEDLLSISKKIVEIQKDFKSGVDPAFILSLFVIESTNSGPTDTQTAEEEKTEKEVETVSKKKATPKDKQSSLKNREINGKWQHFLMEVKSRNNALHAFLRVANPKFSGNSLTLLFPYKFHKEKLEEKKNKRIVEEVIAKVYGQEYEIKCILEGNGGNGKKIDGTSSAISILGGELVEE